MCTATVPRRRKVRGERNIFFRPKSVEDWDAKPPYEAKYQDSDGKWIGPVIATREDGTYCYTLAEAKQFLARVTVAKAEGKLVKREKVTLEEAIDAFIGKPRRGKPTRGETRRTYMQAKAHIPAVLLRRQIGDVRHQDIEAVLRETQREGKGRDGGGLSASQCRLILGVLSGTFKYAMHQGWTGFNPVAVVDRSSLMPEADDDDKLSGILRPEEMKKLLAASSPRWLRVYIELAVFSGLRQSELLGLRWGDLDLDQGVIHVQGQWGRDLRYAPTKTKMSRRRVYIDASTVATLKTWRRECGVLPTSDTYVFRSTTGVPFNQGTVQKAFKHAIELAGIKDRRFHDLRHTYASMLIGEGASIKYVQTQMGHATASITLDTYSSLWNIEADQARHDEAMKKVRREAGL